MVAFEWKYESPGAKYGVNSSVKLMMSDRSVVRAGSLFSQSELIFSRALELHFSGYKTLLTPQRAWREKNCNCNFMKHDFIFWQLECHYIYWMLDFSPVGGKTTNNNSRSSNGSIALQTRAAHYLLESEHAPTNGCGDVYNSSNKARRKTDPQSSPHSLLSPLMIAQVEGGKEWWMPADGISPLSSVMEKSAFACGLSCGWLNSPVSPQSR